MPKISSRFEPLFADAARRTFINTYLEHTDMASIETVQTSELTSKFGLSDSALKEIAARMFWQLYDLVKDQRILRKKILFWTVSLYWRDLYDVFVKAFGPPPSKYGF